MGKRFSCFHAPKTSIEDAPETIRARNFRKVETNQLVNRSTFKTTISKRGKSNFAKIDGSSHSSNRNIENNVENSHTGKKQTSKVSHSWTERKKLNVHTSLENNTTQFQENDSYSSVNSNLLTNDKGKRSKQGHFDQDTPRRKRGKNDPLDSYNIIQDRTQKHETNELCNDNKDISETKTYYPDEMKLKNTSDSSLNLKTSTANNLVKDLKDKGEKLNEFDNQDIISPQIFSCRSTEKNDDILENNYHKLADTEVMSFDNGGSRQNQAYFGAPISPTEIISNDVFQQESINLNEIPANTFYDLESESSIIKKEIDYSKEDKTINNSNNIRLLHPTTLEQRQIPLCPSNQLQNNNEAPTELPIYLKDSDEIVRIKLVEEADIYFKCEPELNEEQKEILDRINLLTEKSEIFSKEIEQFEYATDKAQAFHYIQESLLRIIDKLDGLDIDENKFLTKKQRDLIRSIYKMIDTLEQKDAELRIMGSNK